MAQYTMKQTWAGLGGGGLKVSFELLSHLYENECTNNATTPGDDDLPPEPGKTDGPDRDPYLTVNDSDIDITYYGLDTDNEIIPSIKKPNPQTYDEITDVDYFLIIDKMSGTGTGGDPERILQLSENTAAVPDFIRDVSPRDTGLFVPIFSLDGGSGNGFFRKHIDMIDQPGTFTHEQNRNQSSEDTTTIAPICISPLRSQDRRVQDGETRASENVSECLNFIKTKLEDGLIDFAFVVDNDFAGFNREVNDNYTSYKSVKNVIEEVHSNGDTSAFYNTHAPDVTLEEINKSIVDALYAFAAISLRGPKQIKFGQATQAGVDHTDMANFFKGKFVVPSHLDISSRRVIDEQIFNRYSFGDDRAKRLAFLSYYAFLSSCAPLNPSKIQNLKIFIWESGQSVDVTEPIEAEINNLLSSIGIGRDRITVDPVKGIQDQESTIKVWTMTGVKGLNDRIMPKFRGHQR